MFKYLTTALALISLSAQAQCLPDIEPAKPKKANYFQTRTKAIDAFYADTCEVPETPEAAKYCEALKKRSIKICDELKDRKLLLDCNKDVITLLVAN